MSDDNHVRNKKQQQTINTPIGKKQKILNFFTIILVAISIGLSAYNLNNIQPENIVEKMVLLTVIPL